MGSWFPAGTELVQEPSVPVAGAVGPARSSLGSSHGEQDTSSAGSSRRLAELPSLLGLFHPNWVLPGQTLVPRRHRPPQGIFQGVN